MPAISRFLGIVIYMYHGDHVPPHFHARYGQHEAQFSIPGLMVIEGRLPPRVTGLIVEWASAHLPELQSNWQLARNHAALKQIDPLE